MNKTKNKLQGYFPKSFSIAGIGCMFDAMDVGIISFIVVAISQEWNLTLYQQSIIPSINSIGMAAGALLFGILADKIGRKNIFITTMLLFSVCSGLTALTNQFVVFIILRFFIGMGLGGELPIGTTLVLENTPAVRRGRIVVLLNSFWSLGWLIAACISYFIIPSFGWRVAMILCATPAFFALYSRLKIPETTKLTKNDLEQSMINKIKLIFAKIHVKKTIMLWILWFSIVFSYYGMFLWLPKVLILKGFTLITSFKYTLLMTLSQLPGYLTAAWLVEKIGRKSVLILFLFGTAISSYFFGNSSTVLALLICGAFLSYFNMGAFGCLYAYSPEQYPANIRGTGVGFATSVGRIGGIIGPLLIPILVSKNFSVSTIFNIFCLIIFIGILSVTFLGKETKSTNIS